MAALVVLFGLALFAGLTVLALLAKLAIRIVFLPLFLLKWIITGVVMLVVGPVLAIVAIALAFAFALVLAVPMLPLLVLGAIVWLLVRATRRPALV